MLLVLTHNCNILLESAKYNLRALKNAANTVLAPPYCYSQLPQIEKYEVQSPLFFTPQSSIYLKNGYEQPKTPMIAHTKNFWILRYLEVLILLQAIILHG